MNYLKLPLIFLFMICMSDVFAGDSQLEQSHTFSSSNILELTKNEQIWLRNHSVIRVHNEKNWPPFNFFNHGLPRGLSIEYMNLIAERLGLKIEYITGPSWNDFLDMIHSGKLDVMLNIVKTLEREKYILFSKPYARNPNTIISRKDNLYKNIDNLDGKTVSVVKGFFYEEVIKKSHPKIKMLLMKDTNACLEAVSLGKADAALGELAVVDFLMHKNMLSNLSLSGSAFIGDPDLENLRIGVGKNLPLLYSAINKAMASITSKEMGLLQDKWLFRDVRNEVNSDNFFLSVKEKQWLLKHRHIRLGVDDAFPPFEFIDKDGKYKGIAASILLILEKRLGVSFELVHNRNWGDTLAGTKKGRVDLMSLVTPTDERKKFLDFSKPYIKFQQVFLTRKDFPAITKFTDFNGKTIAVSEGYAEVEMLKAKYPGVKQLLVKSPLDELLAVATGRADVSIGSLSVVSYLLEKNNIPNIKIAGMSDLKIEDLALGVRKDWHDLVPILNKALNSISKLERRDIYNKWIGSKDQDDEIKIRLSSEEKEWLKKHPVVNFTGDPDWLPQEAFDENGKYVGIVAEYLAYVESKIPLKFNKIHTKTWKESVELAKNGNVDVLSETVGNKDREKYLRFTRTYLSSPIVILTRNTSENLTSAKDLKDKAVVLVRNYGYLEELVPYLPNIKKVYVDTVGDGILKLSRGGADAMAVSQSTGSYIISKLGVTNLMIAQRPPFALNLGLGVRKDWPQLVSILNKVFSTMSPRQQHNIHAKWVPKISTARVAVAIHQPNPLFTLGMIVMGLVLLISVLFFVMHRIGNRLERFQSARVKIIGGCSLFIFLLIVIAGAWFSLQDMENRVRRKTGDALQVITTSTHHLLKGWITDEMHYIQQWASDPELISDVENILRVPRRKEALIASKAQDSLRDSYNNKGKRTEDRGFFVIAPDLISLASTRNMNIGTVNLIAKKRPEMLKRAFAGETVFIPPISSDVPLTDSRGDLKKALPTMFFASPVLNREKEVIAVITIRIDPTRDFSYLCQLGRIGKSGESYAFDEHGYFLSESRFKDQLVRAGLIDSEKSQLSLKIKDPGVNLLKYPEKALPHDRQFLTKLIEKALQDTTGVDTNGYRDYRGVKVLGAWIWDDDLKIGIASEIDQSDALEDYRENSRIIIFVLCVIVVLALALIAYTFWSGEHTKRKLSKARDKWELVAEEQMKAVERRAEWAEGIHHAGLEIALSSSIDELARVAVHATVDCLNLSNAYLGIVNDDGNLTPLAFYSIEGKSLLPDTLDCQMKSLSSGEPVIHIDSPVCDGCESCLFFEEYSGVESCASFPIKIADKSVAVFTISADDKGENCVIAQIIPLLKTLVAQIAYVWERCIADEELHKLSSAVEQSPTTVLITDTEGNIEYVNPRFTQMTGYSFDEVVGENPRLLKAPGVHSSSFYKQIWDTITAGRQWRGELCNKKKNGTFFWESAAISPVRNDSNEIIHYLAVKEDITELKRVRKKIEEQKTFLETTLDSLSHPFYVINADNYEIVMMNSVARAQGVEEAKTCHKLTHQSDLPCSGSKDPCPLEEVRVSKKPAVLEHVHYDADGNEVIAEVHGYPILDANGKVIQMIEYSLDITERKKTEDELKAAKEDAEAATKAKGDFLANMSHEIRTPMNAIIGMNHLLQKTEMTDKQINYVVKVDRAAHNLLGIINDILDFSKIEAGKLNIENINFNLDEVMDNLANLTSDNAHKKGLELIFDIPQNIPQYLIGDPLRLGQVMLNFVSNAVKFTERGEIVISAELLESQEKSVFIKFKVCDSGIGLTEEQQKKLFQSFSQADSTTTRKFGGTGLGLAISKKLVELMGGEVGLTSEFGKGSEFFFTVKCGLQRDGVEKIGLLAQDIKGIHVLIVDDNEIARDVLQHYVEDFLCDVTAVSSGKEALLKMEETLNGTLKPFDLVLMDWKMPEMSGLEVALNLKNNSKLSKIPQIIMVTNYGREEVMVQAENIGIDGFLIKPVAQSMLLDTIMNTFGKYVKRDPRTKCVSSSIVFSGEKILLVEDNEINQEVAVGLLNDAGLSIDVADNGRVACDMLKKYGESFYDVVLMDLQMPEMDGYSASEFIREELGYDKIPIVAMSADAMLGVRENCLNAGMNDYLTKPIDPSKLFELLQKWIKSESKNLSRDCEMNNSGSLLGLLSGFDDLDAVSGLERVGGDHKVYLSILHKFCDRHSEDSRKIIDAVRKFDYREAEIIAHTLKGVAGNIGAEKVFESAKRIDVLLKDKINDSEACDVNVFSTQIEILLNRLDLETSDLIEKIIESENISKEQKKDGIVNMSDPEKARELLEKLYDLLEDDDSEAQDCLDELMTVSDIAELNDISEMIADYEFDGALELLKKIQKF